MRSYISTPDSCLASMKDESSMMQMLVKIKMCATVTYRLIYVSVMSLIFFEFMVSQKGGGRNQIIGVGFRM
jgi:hypothetical protein